MLTKCPECNLQVSDKAVTCPHCGFPLKNIPQKRVKRKPVRDHRRLPNGFGRITKLNRNLTNPYRVMVTVGHDENGKPIGKLLKPQAYFPTYNDAYMALVEYNRKPYELDKEITLAELYEKWLAKVKPEVNISTYRGYTMAWNYCKPVHDLPVRKIRIHHLRHCVEQGFYEKDGIVKPATPAVQTRIKMLFNLLFDYAVEYELIDTNPARAFGLSKQTKKAQAQVSTGHIRFTDEEMRTLWEHLNDTPYVDVILMQCYSGWRPQEIGLLKLKDIDFENWTMTGGIKTEAGTDRVVPIHTAIRPIIRKLYDEALQIGSEYLVNTKNMKTPTALTYHKYKFRFGQTILKLGLNEAHRPHDPRKQFVSMGKDAGMNEYAIKRIVGHTIPDITERIYTEHDPDWLRNEIEKIKADV